jgi:hypothetical protein
MARFVFTALVLDEDAEEEVDAARRRAEEAEDGEAG